MSSIFSMIIDGQLPGHFVWQDDKAVAIMTIQPVQPGHVLVIPREEIDHWDDLPADLAAHLMTVSQHIAKAQKQVYQCARVGMSIVGLEVPHTHLHVIPINAMNDMACVGAAMAEQEDLAANAEKLRQQLLRDGHSQAEV